MFFALAAIFARHWYIVIPLLLVLRFAYFRYASPLRRYPGPFLASGSRAWKVLSTYRGHTETDHIKIHEKYGPIVRIGPNELSFASAAAGREILAPGRGFTKPTFYAVFPPHDSPDIFTERDESKHGIKKRHAMPAYSQATMFSMTPFIEECERALASKLNNMCQTTDRVCHLGDYLHYFAFDVLGEIAFSRKFGFLEAGIDVEKTIQTINDEQWYLGMVGQVPEWDFVFHRNPLWKYIPGMAATHTFITRMALKEMETRKKSGIEAGRKDFLSHLVAAHEKAPQAFSDKDVFAIAHGAIFAGADSTSSSMQAFINLVLRNPTVHAKLKQELDQATLEDRLSLLPQWSEVQHLPYFQACLKESMRMRPALGLNISRQVPTGGLEVDGHHIPTGTVCALNAWVLHRDTSVFGSDADTFRPERWIEGDAKAMERSMFQFGGGAHLCTGKHLALLEMSKTLPLLFRDYNFELLQPTEEIKYHSTFFVVHGGLDVRIARRN